MNYTLPQIIKVLVRISPVRCSVCYDLEDYLLKTIKIQGTVTPKHVFGALKKIADQSSAKKMDPKGVWQKLMQEDVKTILANMPKINPLAKELQMLPRYYAKLVDEIKQWGFEFPMPSFEIVDRYPKPYDQKTYLAMAFDREDKEKYGIEPHIGFRREVFRPIQSGITLAHELIHYIPSSVNAHGAGQLLEEGLALLLGDYYLGSKIISTKYILNWLINIRFSCFKKDFDLERYSNGLKMACLFYLEYGLKGIIKMFKQGRPGISAIEDKLLAGKFTRIDLPRGIFKPELDKTAKYLLLYPRFLEFSSLAYYVSRFIKQGDSIENIAEKSGLSLDKARKALNEIAKGALIVIADNRITSNDIGNYINIVKYRF